MKILTVRQPWASLIADGRKTVEVRSWRTHYRGWVIVHAGRWRGADLPPSRFPRGVTVCVANLYDCVPYVRARHARAAALSRSPSGMQTYAWLLRDVRQVRQVGIQGQQGLFDAPTDLVVRLGLDICELEGIQLAVV